MQFRKLILPLLLSILIIFNVFSFYVVAAPYLSQPVPVSRNDIVSYFAGNYQKTLTGDSGEYGITNTSDNQIQLSIFDSDNQLYETYNYSHTYNPIYLTNDLIAISRTAYSTNNISNDDMRVYNSFFVQSRSDSSLKDIPYSLTYHVPNASPYLSVTSNLLTSNLVVDGNSLTMLHSLRVHQENSTDMYFWGLITFDLSSLSYSYVPVINSTKYTYGSYLELQGDQFKATFISSSDSMSSWEYTTYGVRSGEITVDDVLDLNCSRSDCAPFFWKSPQLLEWEASGDTINLSLVSKQETSTYKISDKTTNTIIHPNSLSFISNKYLALSLVVEDENGLWEGSSNFYLVDMDSRNYVAVNANPVNYERFATNFATVGDDLLYITQDLSTTHQFVVVRRSFAVPQALLWLRNLGWFLPIALVPINLGIIVILVRKRLKPRYDDNPLYPKE